MTGERSSSLPRFTQRLSYVLAVLMAVQGLTGRIASHAYRDPEWIAATWIGNDWLTALIAAPMFLGATVLASQGRVRGWMLWLGTLWYAAYNSLFYLFGAALNAFFPIYVATFVVTAVALVRGLSELDLAWFASQFSDHLPRRFVGGYLVFVAVGLAGAWLAMWAGYAFAGADLPVEREAFQVVATLDLILMVPVLSIGGVLLWRRVSVGYVLASLASIQGALYLSLLTINSIIGIGLGLAESPGEVPVWGPLAVGTIIAAAFLVRSASPRRH